MEGLVYLIFGSAALGALSWLILIIWQRVEYVRFKREVREVRQASAGVRRTAPPQRPDALASPTVSGTNPPRTEPDSPARQSVVVQQTSWSSTGEPLVWIHARGEVSKQSDYLVPLAFAAFLVLALVVPLLFPDVISTDQTPQSLGIWSTLIVGSLGMAWVGYRQRFRISPLIVEISPHGFMTGYATPVRISFINLDDRAWLSMRWQCGTQFNYVSMASRTGAGQVEETLAEGIVLKQLPVTPDAAGLLWEGVIDIPAGCLPSDLSANLASRLHGELIVTLRRTKSAEITNYYPIRFWLQRPPIIKRQA